MDKPILVNDDKQAGAQLLRLLDRAGIPVEGAFWYEPTESDRWQLFVVSPWVDSPRGRLLYERLREILDDQNPKLAITVDDVTMRSPGDNIVRDLAALLRFRPGPRHVDVIKDWTGDLATLPRGERIIDAYVYRLRAPDKATSAARRR